jgi:hypothetical protein
MTRQIKKPSAINARITPKVRFGLSMISAKTGASTTALIEKAIGMLLESEELTTRNQADGFISLLDRCWSEKEGARLRNTLKNAPWALAGDDLAVAVIIEAHENDRGKPFGDEELEEKAREFRALLASFD